MGQAKRVRTTPANHLHSRKPENGINGSRRAALASLFALSGAVGASAIVVSDALLPKPAAAKPVDLDAELIAHVAFMLPAIERLEVLCAEERRQGRKKWTAESRALYDATLTEAETLALMRPRTLPGFIAKARIARYHVFLAIHIARDLEASGNERGS